MALEEALDTSISTLLWKFSAPLQIYPTTRCKIEEGGKKKLTLPKSLTPSRTLLWTQLLFRNSFRVIFSPALILPRSIHRCKRFKFNATYSLPSLTSIVRMGGQRDYGLWNPRLGNRLCSGVWPPSKPGLGAPLPDLAFCPLWPLPLVLPRPELGPRPTRFLWLMAPGLSLRTFKVTGKGRGRIGLASNCCTFKQIKLWRNILPSSLTLNWCVWVRNIPLTDCK